jgi:hypothetical protein
MKHPDIRLINRIEQLTKAYEATLKPSTDWSDDHADINGILDIIDFGYGSAKTMIECVQKIESDKSDLYKKNQDAYETLKSCAEKFVELITREYYDKHYDDNDVYDDDVFTSEVRANLQHIFVEYMITPIETFLKSITENNNTVNESEVTPMNDLLNQIDLIQEMTDDADLEVMMSLSDAYEKQLLMMESCDSLFIMEDGESSDKVQSVTKRNLKEKIIHFIKQLWRKIVVIFNKAKISILINSTIKEINKHEDDKIPFTVDNLTVLTRNSINRLKTCTSLWSDFINRYSKEAQSESSREENIKAIITFLDNLNRQLESDDTAYNKASGEKKSQKTITIYQVNHKEVVEFLENEKAAYETLLKNTMTISKIIDKLEITEKDVADNAGGDSTSDRYTTIINRLKNASNMYYKYMLNQTRIIAKICVDTKAVLKNKTKDAIVYTEKDRDMLELIHLLATITNKTDDYLKEGND